MLIDYLRYAAFSGRFRSFFESGVYKFLSPEDTTGQHISFSPKFFEENWGIREKYLRRHKDYYDDYLYYIFGIHPSEYRSMARGFVGGERPPTRNYEKHIDGIQITIDVAPERWKERYSESLKYEGADIVFRKSSHAKSQGFRSERLINTQRRDNDFGSLCGFIYNRDTDKLFGLTCGHITNVGDDVILESSFKIWDFGLFPTYTSIGKTRYRSLCCTNVAIGDIRTNLDVALIESKKRLSNHQEVTEDEIMPITSILQEDSVFFKGSGRTVPKLARISAVTVRKSIDILNNGQMVFIGDVLMLGHALPRYVSECVSRRGDSGSAVLGYDGPYRPGRHWYGMIIGGDDCNSYASHAECLWSWVIQNVGTNNISFHAHK